MAKRRSTPSAQHESPRPAPTFIRSSAWRFLLRAAAWMLVLYGFYYFPYERSALPSRAIDAFLQWQARAAGVLISIFDPSVRVHDAVISGRFPLQIVKSCSSLDAQALYAATVAAFPARLRDKVLGLCAGVALLTALNLARIATLYFVGGHAPTVFDAVHEELFPLVLVAAACAGFAGWARWAHGLDTDASVQS